LAADGTQHGLAPFLAFLVGLEGLLAGGVLSCRLLSGHFPTRHLALGLQALGLEAGHALALSLRTIGVYALSLASGGLRCRCGVEPGRLQAHGFGACCRLTAFGLATHGLFVLGRHAGGFGARGNLALSFLTRGLALALHAQGLEAGNALALGLRTIGVHSLHLALGGLHCRSGVEPGRLQAHGFGACCRLTAFGLATHGLFVLRRHACGFGARGSLALSLQPRGLATHGLRPLGRDSVRLGLRPLVGRLLLRALLSLALLARSIRAGSLAGDGRIRRRSPRSRRRCRGDGLLGYSVGRSRRSRRGRCRGGDDL